MEMEIPRSARLRTRGLSGKDLQRSSSARIDLLLPLAGEISGESFSPTEAAAFCFGRRELARRILRRVWLRARVEKSGILALGYRPQEQNLPARPRPAPVLSKLNRSPVFPPLVLPEATHPSVQFFEILEIVRQAHVEGQSWPRLLDVLVTSAGVDWLTGAIVLKKIIGCIVPEEEIAIVAGARQFWRHYAEGRARMVALQTARELPVWHGDWAHFDRGQFADLLPGAVLPDHCERHEFLANYLHEEPGLDFYSMIGQPLFRHPFTPRFRALT
jgi:hypothetical protein